MRQEGALKEKTERAPEGALIWKIRANARIKHVSSSTAVDSARQLAASDAKQACNRGSLLDDFRQLNSIKHRPSLGKLTRASNARGSNV